MVVFIYLNNLSEEKEIMAETNCCHVSSEDNSDIEKNLTDTFCQVNKRYEHHLNTSNVYQTLNLPDRFERSCNRTFGLKSFLCFRIDTLK